MRDYIGISTLILAIISSGMTQKDSCCLGCKTCKSIEECSVTRNLLHNGPLEQSTIDRLRHMFCGFNDQIAVVCCPDDEASSDSALHFPTEEPATSRTRFPTTTSLPDIVLRTTEGPETSVPETPELQTESPAVLADPFPPRTICGQSATNDKIYGGDITAIGEFPWLARIKYENLNKKFSFNCGASLITQRHLVAAAHCFPNTTSVAKSVRLGEWNTESPTECYKGRCPPLPVEIEIESLVTHPQFKKSDITFADIAIIKLKESVNFTEYIQPICLPTTEYIYMQDYSRESIYYAAGWGLTEYRHLSVLKRKVDLEAVPMEICRVALPGISDSSSSALICAGGRAGKDTCRGDSGGPLMREVAENYIRNWFLYGITSFGSKACGQEGLPSVYTRVTAYMDWIRETVRRDSQISSPPSSSVHFIHA